MRYINLTILAFAFLCVLPGTVHTRGAGNEWKKLNSEAIELQRVGNYDRAVLTAKKALRVAEENVGPNHPDVAESLNNLGLLYDIQGEYSKAEMLYKRALAIWEEKLGPDHPNVAAGLNNLAELYRIQNRDHEAAVLKRRAAEIYSRLKGPAKK